MVRAGVMVVLAVVSGATADKTGVPGPTVTAAHD